MKRFLCLIVIILLVSGCASTAKVARGMSKEEVLQAWGTPDKIMSSKNSCCKEKNEENWYYLGTLLQIKEAHKAVMFENDVVKYAFYGL